MSSLSPKYLLHVTVYPSLLCSLCPLLLTVPSAGFFIFTRNYFLSFGLEEASSPLWPPEGRVPHQPALPLCCSLLCFAHMLSNLGTKQFYSQSKDAKNFQGVKTQLTALMVFSITECLGSEGSSKGHQSAALILPTNCKVLRE